MGNNSIKEQENDSLPFIKRNNDQFGNYNQLQQGIQERCNCPLKVRLIGFAICCGIGWFLSILSTISFLINRDAAQFAILYSIGQVCNISGSCFLAGPIKQAKSMAKRQRVIFSAAYIILTILTLVLALTLSSKLGFLVIFSLIAQMISYFLYALTYIPFGQRILKRFLRIAIE